MKKQDILSKVDHTLLRQDSTWEEIKKICDEGIEHEVASVCIPPSYVKQAADYVKGQIPICTVVGFPNGYSVSEIKAREANIAILHGAKEIDMVINVGWLKDKRYKEIENEIRLVAGYCHNHNRKNILKVIIETCLLTDDEIEKMCEICARAGADYIKTSTGFSKEGANEHVVTVMVETIKNNNYCLKVKAAGGIKSVEDAEKFIKLGAYRLGTSKLIELLK